MNSRIRWNMNHKCCIAVVCCAATIAVGLLIVPPAHIAAKLHCVKQLATRVASTRHAERTGGSWLKHFFKAVNISLQQKNLRRKREVGDEVEICTEESCVEGVCSEDKTRCVCSDGFSGKYCQYNINECRSDPCKNEARCIDGVNRYYCDCNEGWTGDDCSDDFDECSSTPCYNRAECITPRFSMFYCRCRSGFYGVQCENDIDECWSHPCRNGGSCVDMVDRYLCICTTGFNGTNCEEEIDECASSPCKNGGICLDNENEFQCQCLDGYLGVDCSDEVDKCRDVSCENGGECVAGIDRPFCRCARGFEGEFCDRETDECLQSPCRNSGSCIDLEADYECICPDGFEGQNCEVDINECKSQPCQNSGRCNDDINEYFCDCSNGFMGDQCEVDVDECASSPCRNDGECRDRVGGFHCFCTHGFTGELCDVEINACLSNPCENAASCNEEPGGKFRCECVPGFVGERCEIDTNECSSAPCNNGGRCVDLVDRFICECAAGYKGDLCDVEEDECESNPCRNRGRCIDGRHSFRCVCTRFYEGTLCELKVTFCQPNTCLNGGKCVEDEVDGFACECIAGFDGDICQRNIDECAQSSCENGGLCIDGVGSYTCLCRDGYQGKNCNDTALADARKLSQTMLSTIPAAGILVLCVVTVALTIWCLRRQQTSIEGLGHVIDHDAATNLDARISNGRSSRYPNTVGSKNGAVTELPNDEKGSKSECKKFARDGRSQIRNTAKKGDERVSKRKKKGRSKANGKDSGEKNVNGEMKRKRRRLENGKTKGVRHERKTKTQSNVEKRNPRSDRSMSKRVSIDHPQIPLENEEIPEKYNADPKPDHQKRIRDNHGVEDISALGGTSNVNKHSLSLKEKPKKVSKLDINMDENEMMKNGQQEISKFRHPISTSLGEDDFNVATPNGTNFIEQAIPVHKGMKSNYQSLPKQSNTRCNDGSGDSIKKSSPENSPVYLPVKTANGIPLYLPLGRLDHRGTYQPTITESSPNSNEFVKRRSAKSPLLKTQSSPKKSPPQYSLSSPWQPVWKYNFPHLLMEDTQLERQFSYTEERKRVRTARSRSALGQQTFTEPSQLTKDCNSEAVDDGSLKERAGMQKTFLKEEIGLLVNTREYWQTKEKKDSAVSFGAPKSIHSPDHLLSYSRHFAPSSHQVTPDEEEVDDNEEFNQNPKDPSLFYAYQPSIPASLKDSLPVAAPKSVSELWERSEYRPIATNKLEDEAWKNDSSDWDNLERERKCLARSDGFVNEFGIKNPRGMNRENAFVNGQI